MSNLTEEGKAIVASAARVPFDSISIQIVGPGEWIIRCHHNSLVVWEKKVAGVCVGDTISTTGIAGNIPVHVTFD